MRNLLYVTLVILWLPMIHSPVMAQRKVVSELTLVYEYTATSDPKGKPDASENAVHTIYIKGNKSRSEMTNALFSSTTIFDANTGSAVILREVNGQKLLIRLSPANWLEKSKPFDGIVFKNTNETKNIAGYPCVKAVGQTQSVAVISVYYTRELVPENRQYDPQFRNLDGLPLEYELTSGDVKLRYKVSRISLNPVPASKFDIPSAGYREMNYEESKKMNVGS